MFKRSAKEVRLSLHAREDLLEVGAYLLKSESVESASRMLERIHTKARSLEHSALIWRERGELFPHARVVLAHPYAIVYRIDDRIVNIVRIVHGRRDLEALFTDEQEI